MTLNNEPKSRINQINKRFYHHLENHDQNNNDLEKLIFFSSNTIEFEWINMYLEHILSLSEV